MHPLETHPKHELDFSHIWYKPVRVSENGAIKIGALRFTEDVIIDLGTPFGEVPVWFLRGEAHTRSRLTNDQWQPQLAVYVFMLSRKPQAMNGFFPLTRSLDKAQQLDFYKLIVEIAQKPTLDIRLVSENMIERTRQMPPDVGFLIAGHLAEIFFFRRDILDAFFKTEKRFWLYTTPRAYAHHGGVAGGMFNSSIGAIQLVLNRLYEGFFAETPGAAPFLHELGHMLDHSHPSEGWLGRGVGLLPGLRHFDGDLYSAEARALFNRGKQLELERYLNWHHGTAREDDPLPIGHPYVFQNDGEFVAGYFEMFFRNPHYFAKLNPDLYAAFSNLFRQDPRIFWREDFPFYIQQNRDFYLSGEPPPAPNLTIR